MAAQAVSSLQDFCSQAVAEQRLQVFLGQLFERRFASDPEMRGA